MATLDGSIVNISLPKIQQAFGVDLAAIEWVVVAYLLAVGSLLLPFGRLGDIVGYRRVYVAGFAAFTAAVNYT
ncbi:MAG: MFS transporter, partial [Thermomicrobiaceae bacterium]|nr:MFS transporter [Thermomicrobiaceae bacterium]